jgi:hypothetical protein
MARLKKCSVGAKLPNGLGSVIVDVIYHVNSDGEFYCEIPSEILSFFEEYKTYSEKVSCSKNKVDKLSIYANSLADLESILIQAITDVNQPIITNEYVIRYNIESQVSFAENSDGDIFPNAGYPNAEWSALDDSKMYGRLHASNQACGGYSLCVGAQALVKKTTKVGEKCTVEYSRYYKGGNHHGNANPAERLNSWVSFSLPKDCKEIPYTDEAAIFFHDIMYGMAKLSKLIQLNTFEQSALLETITASSLGKNLLGFSSNGISKTQEN